MNGSDISEAADDQADQPDVSSRLLRLRVRKLAWLIRRPRWWPLIPRGLGPSLEHADLLVGRDYRTVLDIGANAGQFALWAREALGPEPAYAAFSGWLAALFCLLSRFTPDRSRAILFDSVWKREPESGEPPTRRMPS